MIQEESTGNAIENVRERGENNEKSIFCIYVVFGGIDVCFSSNNDGANDHRTQR